MTEELVLKCPYCTICEIICQVESAFEYTGRHTKERGLGMIWFCPCCKQWFKSQP